MEINPNHPTTRAISEQWHKVAALLMMKLRTDHAIITPADIRNMQEGTAITIQELPDGIHLWLVDGETAQLLAKKEGGLPA